MGFNSGFKGLILPIPMAARYKAWACGRSHAGIAGSNPAGGIDVCCECCVSTGRGLCNMPIPWAEESYWVCMCVCVYYHVEQQPQHLQWVATRCQTTKEGKIFYSSRLKYILTLYEDAVRMSRRIFSMSIIKNNRLTLRRLMSYIYIYIYIYIYGAPILDVSRSHTTTQHSR